MYEKHLYLEGEKKLDVLENIFEQNPTIYEQYKYCCGLLESADSKYGYFIEEANFIFGQTKKPHIILSIDILGRRFEEVHY